MQCTVPLTKFHWIKAFFKYIISSIFYSSEKNWIVFFSSFFYFLLLHCDKFAYSIWLMCFSYWHKFIWFIDFLKNSIFISHHSIFDHNWISSKKTQFFVFQALEHAIQFDLFIRPNVIDLLNRFKIHLI